MKRKFLIWILACLFQAACVAILPEYREITSAKDSIPIDLPQDETWSLVLDALKTCDYQIENTDKAAGMIYARRAGTSDAYRESDSMSLTVMIRPASIDLHCVGSWMLADPKKELQKISRKITEYLKKGGLYGNQNIIFGPGLSVFIPVLCDAL
jgi:hypothetical protein